MRTLGPYRLANGPMLPTPCNPGRLRWRRRAIGMGALLLVVLGLWAVQRPLLVGFAQLFRVEDPAPSEAIVLLLGGPNHRPQRAAALFRAGLAPRILLAQSERQPEQPFDETELTCRNLRRHGVPSDAIVVLPKIVTSTRDEAQAVRAYVRTHPMRRITLITSRFHTARARWIFRRTLEDLGVEVRATGIEHPQFSETNWYQTEAGLVAYFEELIKMILYRLRY
ncbi:MAG: YdcF family protein [Isosphaeraceae bacterium]|nr:YdcF family protein [Isosphaeraceae bacterium]